MSNTDPLSITMTSPFTKQAMARLTRDERYELMLLQMSRGSTAYGGGGYLPDDCSECGSCGTPVLGTGWCGACHNRFNVLCAKARGEAVQS